MGPEWSNDDDDNNIDLTDRKDKLKGETLTNSDASQSGKSGKYWCSCFCLAIVWHHLGQAIPKPAMPCASFMINLTSYDYAKPNKIQLKILNLISDFLKIKLIGVSQDVQFIANESHYDF